VRYCYDIFFNNNCLIASPSSRAVCGRSPAEIVGSNPTGGMDVCCECCVLSGRGLCDGLITCPEESYRLWCVVVCDLETSWMRRPWPALGRSATNNNDNNNNNNCLIENCVRVYILYISILLVLLLLEIWDSLRMAPWPAKYVAVFRLYVQFMRICW